MYKKRAFDLNSVFKLIILPHIKMIFTDFLSLNTYEICVNLYNQWLKKPKLFFRPKPKKIKFILYNFELPILVKHFFLWVILVFQLFYRDVLLPFFQIKIITLQFVYLFFVEQFAQ